MSKEWASADKILEESADDSREAGNRELEEEEKSNSDIEENQLGSPKYKLNIGNGKFSRERRKKILGKEMAGIRKETPKKETYNWYGDAAWPVEIKSLEEHVAFLRALRKDVRKAVVCINGMFLAHPDISHLKMDMRQQTNT